MGDKQKLQEVWSLANSLMRQHGLIDKRWSFNFNKRKSSLGLCSHSKRVIELSTVWVDTLPMEDIRRTILHEIAHALSPRTEGHGKIWKEMCCKVGIPDEARCYTNIEVTRELDKRTSKWKMECPTCGKVKYRHRRSYRSQSCGDCSGGCYNPEHKMVWSLND